MTSPIDYAAVLADLKARRRQLDIAIASIETILGATGGTADVESASEESDYPLESLAGPIAPIKARQNNAGTLIQNDTFFGLSTPEAVKKYLAMMKRPQKVSDISKALLEGGQIHARDATTAYNNAYASLKRLRKAGEAVRIKSGEWALAEWYSSNRPRTEAE